MLPEGTPSRHERVAPARPLRPAKCRAQPRPHRSCRTEMWSNTPTPLTLERRASRLEGACVLHKCRHDAPRRVMTRPRARLSGFCSHHPAQAHARDLRRWHRGSRELFRSAERGPRRRHGREAPLRYTQRARPPRAGGCHTRSAESASGTRRVGRAGCGAGFPAAAPVIAEGDGLGHARLEVCLASRAPWATR